MRFMLVLAHPTPGSFNHALAGTVHRVLAEQGVTVNYHDLYEEAFPPVLPSSETARDADLPDTIRQHCEELRSADGIVVIHPNWWGQPPAIMKGWIDRVFRPGVAYRFVDGDSGEGVPLGLLKARIAIVFNTTNTQLQREMETFGDPLETTWRNCIFGLCGVNNVVRRTFGVIATSTSQMRAQWLDAARDVVAQSVRQMRERPDGYHLESHEFSEL